MALHRIKILICILIQVQQTYLAPWHNNPFKKLLSFEDNTKTPQAIPEKKNSTRNLTIKFDISRLTLREETGKYYTTYLFIFGIIQSYFEQSLSVSDEPSSSSQIRNFFEKVDELSSEINLAQYESIKPVYNIVDSNNYELVIVVQQKEIEDPQDLVSPDQYTYSSIKLRHNESKRPIMAILELHPRIMDYAKKFDNPHNVLFVNLAYQVGRILAFSDLTTYHTHLIKKFDKYGDLEFFIGEKTKKLASVFYNCENGRSKNGILGIPLEPKTTPDSEGHFSQYYLKDEIMAWSDFSKTPMTIISKFFFSVLEDTDWYQVDYKFSEFFVYQKGKGCGWYCIKDQQCDLKDKSNRLTPDSISLGICQYNPNFFFDPESLNDLSGENGQCTTLKIIENENCSRPDLLESNVTTKSENITKNFGGSFNVTVSMLTGKFYRLFGNREHVDQKSHYLENLCAKTECFSDSGKMKYKIILKKFLLKDGKGDFEYKDDNVEIVCEKKERVWFNKVVQEKEDLSSWVNCLNPDRFCLERFGLGEEELVWDKGQEKRVLGNVPGKCGGMARMLEDLNGVKRCFCYNNRGVASSCKEKQSFL